MISSLPLNDSSIFLINRDIALLLGLLTLISFVLRAFRLSPQTPGLKQVCAFLKDSFWEIGLIFILRSLFYEMYIIPSSSMQPTVYPGDVILVNKYNYGMKIPGLNTTFYPGSQPKRGDVIVFLDPEQPTVRKMIKRVIGLPGDHLVINNEKIQINGQPLPTSYVSQGFDFLPSSQHGSVRVQTQFYKQEVDAHSVLIQQTPILEDPIQLDLTIPQGSYFVMGDNRQNSKDSRYIGFVPERFICGQAQYVIMSFGKPHGYYEWDRVGVLP